MYSLILLLGLAAGPKIDVSEHSFDFGHALVTKDYRHTFWLYNRGDAPLQITKIRNFCGCTTTNLRKNLIAPGDSASFDLIFDTRGFFANRVKWVFIRSNDPVDSLLMVNITARLHKDYKRIPLEVDPHGLNFNRLDSMPDEVILTLSNPTEITYNLEIIEIPEMLMKFELPQSAIAPGEELQIIIRPGSGKLSMQDFKASITFEAWTATEIVRFSLPLDVQPKM